MRVINRLGSVLTLLVALIATAMVMGLLAAGLLIPAVGSAGLASNGSIALFNGLPATFAMNPLAQQSRILAADGSTIATPFNENRVVVPLSKVAPIMRKAQVAIEDQRFYQHGAIDPKGLLRAVSSNAQGGGLQGASTLTQQYVKVALENQARDAGNTNAANRAVTQDGLQGYVRKLQQLRYAIALEQKYSKDQILDGYLNIVYFGDQQYGIEAAAEHYFSVHASQLSLPEAALLAGVVNQPTSFDPVTNPKDSQARRNTVLQAMLQQKIITHQQYSAAVALPVSKMLKLKNVSGNCSSSQYPYFCNYVTNWLYQQPALGTTRAARMATLKSGGLTIKTTFQPKMAAIINAQLRAKVPTHNQYNINTAAAMIQPGTGDIIAIGQNTSYSNTNSSGKTSLDLANSSFTFGSSAKYFSIVAALQRNVSPDNTIDVPPQNISVNGQPGTAFPFKDFAGPCYQAPRGTFPMGNDARVPPGPMTYAQATALSVNTAFTQLATQVGMCNIVDTMVKLGLTRSKLQITPAAVVLGAGVTSPIQLANAYATAAAGGKYCPPRPVLSMVDGNGKKLPISVAACKQVMTPAVAAQVDQIFQAVLDPNNPQATGYGSALANSRPAAGKTGTVTGAKNIWFVGYTPQLATAVWIGHSGDQPDLKNITLAGHNYGSSYLFAGSIAAPTWKAIMDAALKGQPVQQFPAVPGNPTSSTSPSPSPSPSQVPVPSVIGQSINAAIATLQAAGFHVQLGPARKGPQPRGQITGTSAAANEAPGTTIFIYPSSG
ncbi:transglycosylase domain-containing protein [Dermatophilaceae bacterium Sec6.4]